MTTNIGVVIVERGGTLKNLCIKSFKENELYKKCGFKTVDNFNKYTDWRIRSKDLTYIISLYGKNVGKANSENKYDFPPPNDNTLFFGSCVIVCHTKYKGETGEPLLESINTELWEKLYEKLFGGFEDLTSTMAEDENEEDELEHIDSSKKTKNGGYLKDGFVVDDDANEDDSEELFGSCEDEDESSIMSDDCSELSEESYIVEEAIP
jgi:hypothetical protein